MVHTRSKSIRRNGKRIRNKNQRTDVIQGNDGDHNGNTRKTPKKIKKDTDRKKRERRDSSGTLDRQKRKKANRAKTGQK